MTELIGLLTNTPVPTILVVAGVIFIFFSMGGRLSAGEIPAQQQRRVGVIGFGLLIVGVVLFALRQSEAAPNTLVSTPPPQVASTATAALPPTVTPSATPVPATATSEATATSPEPTAAPSAAPTEPAITDTPKPTANTDQTPEEGLQTARDWPNLSLDRFNSSSEANWVPTNGALDPHVSLTFNNRFGVAAVPDGTNVIQDFFNEAEIFDAPGDFYLSVEAVGEQTGCYYGLAFRGTLSGEHAVFFVGGGQYGVFISKAQQSIIGFTPLPATALTPTHLEIIGQNGLYRIYADGIYLNQFELGAATLITQGRRVGLYTFVCHDKAEGQFTFDNFELRRP